MHRLPCPYQGPVQLYELRGQIGGTRGTCALTLSDMSRLLKLFKLPCHKNGRRRGICTPDLAGVGGLLSLLSYATIFPDVGLQRQAAAQPFVYLPCDGIQDAGSSRQPAACGFESLPPPHLDRSAGLLSRRQRSSRLTILLLRYASFVLLGKWRVQPDSHRLTLD